MAYDGSLIFDTSIDSKGVEDGLKEIQKTADGYTIGKNIFSNLTTDAIQAAGSALKDAAQTGINFEASMSKVQATSGATTQELESLTALAREYGSSTVFSSSECADALNYMAMAGWNVEQMTNGLPGILNLAASAGEDLGTTSDIVTDALTAFGMQAEDSAHFADVLAIASSKSNTNVAMMGETFKYVAPVAGALGYSAEDVAVAVGLMANSGIKAGQAGTSLRAILSNLTEPTDKQTEAMDALGISLTDSEGGMKTLDELLGDMRTSFSTLTEAEQASYASMIGGQEAMSGLLAIVNASDTDFNDLKTAIYDCDGACDQMAATMTDNVSGELKSLESMTEELELSLYDMFKPMLQDALPKVQDGVEWVTENLDEIVKYGKPIATALAAAFATTKIVGFGSTAVKTIKTVKAALLALNTSNPLGWIALGVSAVAGLGSVVATATREWQQHLDDVRESSAKLTDEQQNIVDSIKETTESWEEFEQTRGSLASAAETEYKNIVAIKEKLDELIESDGKIKEGAEEQVTELLEKLSTYTGECYDISDGVLTKNDKVIESYQKLSGEIDNLIEKQRAQSLLSAYETDYNEKLIERKQILQDLRSQQKEITNEESNLASKQAELNGLKNQGFQGWYDENGITAAPEVAVDEYYQAIDLLEADVSGLKEKLNGEEGLYKAFEEGTATMQEMSSFIQLYESALDSYDNKDYGGVAEFSSMIQSGFITADLASLEELTEQYKAYSEAYQGIVELHEQNPNVITEDDVAEAAALRDLAFDEYLEKINGSADETGRNFIQTLAESGLSEDEKLAALTAHIEEKLNNGESLNKIADELGLDYCAGFEGGIYAGIPGVEEAVKALGAAAEATLRIRLDTHSPSKLSEKIGGWYDEGMIQGVVKGIPDVEAATAQMADAAVSGTLGIMNAQGAGSVSAYSPVYREAYTSPPEYVPAVTGHSESSQSISGAPKISVYIGNEEIRDFIVSAVADENANSGGFSV